MRKGIAIVLAALVLCAGLVLAAPGVASASAPTASQIDNYLVSKGSPMAGQGAAFVQWGSTYGVNPALIVGISGAESTFGKSCYHPYNAWGYGGYTFSSWSDGIQTVTQCIAGSLYFGRGYYSVAQIGPVYDTDGSAQSYWVPFVSGVMTDLGADPSDCRWSGSGSPHLDLDGSLSVDSGPYFIGRQVGVTYTVKNTGGQTGTWSTVILSVRNPANANCDVNGMGSITLAPGAEQTIHSVFKISSPGTWTFGAACQDTGGNWQGVGSGSSLSAAAWGLDLAGPIQATPGPYYANGQSYSASVLVKNTGTQSCTLDGALLLMRGPNGENRDMGPSSGFTLAPGATTTLSWSGHLDLAGAWHGNPGGRIGTAWFPIGAVDSVKFSVLAPTPAALTLVGKPTYTSGPYVLGETFRISYTVKNTGMVSGHWDQVDYVMRGPSGENYDVSPQPAVSLASGETTTIVATSHLNVLGTWTSHLGYRIGTSWGTVPGADLSFSVGTSRIPMLLSCSGPTSCPYSAATLTGTLAAAGGDPLGAETLSVQSSSDGALWTTIGTATTGGNGLFNVCVAPTRTTQYRLVFGGDSIHAPVTSPVVTVKPAAKVGTPKAPKSVKHSKRFTVSGTLLPHHTGAHAVKLYLYRYEKKKWKLKSTVWASATSGGYKASVKLKSKGSWRIRTYHAANANNAAAWSGYHKMKVK